MMKPITSFCAIAAFMASASFSLGQQTLEPKEDPAFLKESALMVDRHVAALYRNKELPVPDVVDDATFLRRSFLVAAGRIPNLEEAKAFLEIEDSTKREDLIFYLMNSDGYRSHLTNYMLDIFRVQERYEGSRDRDADGYVKFIYNAVADNMAWDELTRQLLASEGSQWEEGNGAVGYYVRDKGMELDNLSNTMRIFTGTRMECAQCHDDPFGAYERIDFYHLAAFTNGQSEVNSGPWDKVWDDVREAKTERSPFGRLIDWLGDSVHYSTLGGGGRGRIELPNDYQYSDGDPGEMVGGKTPFGDYERTSDRRDDGDGRQVFAEWITADDNPRYSSTIVNRMWQRVMGRGIWEPVDEFQEEKDTISPALVNDLKGLIKKLDYDLKAFQTVLLLTKTFQFEANPKAFDAGVPQAFNGRQLERMTAEQVWDSLVTLVKGDVESLPRRGFSDAIIYDGKPILLGKKTMADLSQELLAIETAEGYREYAEALLAKIENGGGNGESMMGSSMMSGSSRPGPASGMARASELPTPSPESHFLRAFGQSDRVLLDSATNEANMAQVLGIMNGTVEDMVVSNNSAAVYNALDMGTTERDKVRYLYYAILGRAPRDEEMKFLMRDVIDGSKESYQNLVSALVSTHEFLFVQ
jgi:hypothetical protein